MGGRYGGDGAQRRNGKVKDWNRTLGRLLPDLMPHLRRPAKAKAPEVKSQKVLPETA